MNAWAAITTGWMALQYMAGTYAFWFLLSDIKDRERHERT